MALKKTYTEFNQVFARYLVDQNVEFLNQTDLYNGGNLNPTEYNSFTKRYLKNIKEYPAGTESPLENIIYRYLNGNGIEDTDYYKNSSGTYRFYSANGSFSMIALSSGSGWIYIDVNGEKNPNIIGRDFFIFWLSSRGKLIPYGSKECFLGAYSIPWDWKDYAPMECGTPDTPVLSGNVRGTSCAARIMEEGWEMNY